MTVIDGWTPWCMIESAADQFCVLSSESECTDSWNTRSQPMKSSPFEPRTMSGSREAVAALETLSGRLNTGAGPKSCRSPSERG